MRRLLWLSCLSYLVIGLAHVVGGSVLEQMMTHYQLSYKDSGQWVMNQFLGFLVGVLLAPYLTSKLGKRGCVLLAVGLLTVSEAAYSLLPPWGLMLAIAPLAGFGFGMTEAVIGAMVIDLSEEKATAMSRVEIFFGIGAFLMPTAAGFLIRHEIWQLSFPIVSAIAGITFILWLTMSFGKIDEQIGYYARSSSLAASKPVATDGKLSRLLGGYKPQTIPFVLLSAVFFMIYVGMEMSFANYLPSIMIEQAGVAAADAPAALSLFWGTVIIGRLFAGGLSDRIGHSRYLLFATGGASASLILMALTGQASWMFVSIGLAGLFFSGIFGIALVYANGLVPGMTEKTTSLLVAFGGLGGALFPKLTGWVMDRYGVSQTILMIAFLIVLLFIVLLAMLTLGRKQQASLEIDTVGGN
ncbi:MFS transporter [Paenibacillus sp. NPDC058071]|uniref:MFS transporter n=1 Tax=Paenibacillus sp. NPDC058071 TaxID=3346326 RepID=UPI0036DEA400